MNLKILSYKLKILTIVLLSLMFIAFIEGLIMMKDFMGILKNIIIEPMNLVRYLPIAILLYLFSAEMSQIINSQTPSLRFDFKKTGIIFFQDFQIWLAIFETMSVEKIQTNELKQLKHLKTFSLEVDRKKKSIRVILYSKSVKELEERIKTSKPILEVVLPDINFISKEEVTKLYGKTELLKIGKMYILRERSELSYPQFGSFPKKGSPSISRTVLACNISDEVKNEKKSEFMNCVQLYSFHSFEQTSFFKYMNRRYFKSPRETVAHIKEYQELQRIRLSYQSNKKPLYSFQEGLDHFLRALSSISSISLVSSNIETEEKQLSIYHNYPLIKNQQEIFLDTEKPPSIEMNQICYELCNYYKENKLSNEEKIKRCKKRTDFCLKLLENENFSSILESLIKQENVIDQVHLISELRQHLTFQQLICCFSHLSQQNNPSIPYQKVLNLIHGLFRSIDKANEVPNINKKISSSIFSNDRNSKQISPSLIQN